MFCVRTNASPSQLFIAFCYMYFDSADSGLEILSTLATLSSFTLTL